MPELVLVDVDPVLGRAEPDEEVQDLLRASPGLNLGIDYLPGALGFDPDAHTVDADLASRVLWFDALVGNVDRSWRNPNLLLWHRRLWLIDHGAALVFHHDWPRAATAAERPYDGGRPRARRTGDRAAEAAEALAPRVTRGRSSSRPPRGCPTCGSRTSRASPPPQAVRDGVRRPPACDASPRTPGGSREPRRLRVRAAAGRARGSSAASASTSGVVLYCQARDFLAVAVHVDGDRLRALDAGRGRRRRRAGCGRAAAHLRGRSGPAGETSLGQRFRWLTAPRSTVLQAGPVHSGLTEDPAAELERLVDVLVR